MITQDLLNYIESELAKGTPKEVAQSNLLTNGWTLEDVSEGFSVISKKNQKIVPPQADKPAPIINHITATNPVSVIEPKAVVVNPSPVTNPVVNVKPVEVAPVVEVKPKVNIIQTVSSNSPFAIAKPVNVNPIMTVSLNNPVNVNPSINTKPVNAYTPPVVKPTSEIINPAQANIKPNADLKVSHEYTMPAQNLQQKVSQMMAPPMTENKPFPFMLVAIIFVIILALGGGAFAYFKYFAADFAPKQTETVQNVVVENIPAPVVEVPAVIIEPITSTSSEQVLSASSSIILSINTKENYKVSEDITGATYDLKYTGPSFDAVILYTKKYQSSSTSTATTSLNTSSLDFKTISEGESISDISFAAPAEVKLVATSTEATSTIASEVVGSVNYFSDEGTYTLSMSVYKCSAVAVSGKCSAENVSVAKILKQKPIVSISKTINVMTEIEALPEQGVF